MSKKHKKEHKFPAQLFVQHDSDMSFYSVDEELEMMDEGAVAIYELKSTGKHSRRSELKED